MTRLIPSFILVVFIFLTFACRSTKTIQKAIAKKDTTAIVAKNLGEQYADTIRFINGLIDSIQSHQKAFVSFSARAKVDYANQNGKQPDFLAYIRIKKDSIIWLSLANDLGIEGIRIMVTPDSIKVMDKLAKTIQVRPLSKLQEISQIPFSYADLEHIIVGRPIFFQKDSIKNYISSPETFLLFCKMGDIKNYLYFNKKHLPEKSRIDDAAPALSRRADLIYKDYEDKDGFIFSTFREIFISHKEIFNVQMKFKDYHFNESLSFPFTIPKKFKKIP
jgi:hypothetical protein